MLITVRTLAERRAPRGRVFDGFRDNRPDMRVRAKVMARILDDAGYTPTFQFGAIEEVPHGRAMRLIGERHVLEIVLDQGFGFWEPVRRTPFDFNASDAGIPAAAHHAEAHGFAGDHMFISTLLIDDPNVADEASLPTFSYLPRPTDSGPAPNLYSLTREWDKRITETFGFAIGNGYNWLTQPGAKTANGWSNLVVTLKWKPYVNAEHEFMMSVGVERQFAGTGAGGTNGELLNTALGVANQGSTTPTFYFGEGFGNLPVPVPRPLALTGTLGYAFTDTKLKVDPVSHHALVLTS